MWDGDYNWGKGSPKSMAPVLNPPCGMVTTFINSSLPCNHISSEPTVWDGDEDWEDSYDDYAYVLSPPCGMVTRKCVR